MYRSLSLRSRRSCCLRQQQRVLPDRHELAAGDVRPGRGVVPLERDDREVPEAPRCGHLSGTLSARSTPTGGASKSKGT